MGARRATPIRVSYRKISGQDHQKSISAAWGQQLDRQPPELHEEGQQASHDRLEGKP
jgi:hypothetical protein